MIQKLYEIESNLVEIIDSGDREGQWQTLDIDYHPPHVKRVWCQYDESTRLYLHKIYPCEREEALMHPHNWPSAMRIVKNRYEMGVGGIGHTHTKVKI